MSRSVDGILAPITPMRSLVDGDLAAMKSSVDGVFGSGDGNVAHEQHSGRNFGTRYTHQELGGRRFGSLNRYE